MKFKKVLALLLVATQVFALSACGEEEENRVVIIEHDVETPSYNYAYAAVGDVVKTEKYILTYKQTDAQEIVFQVAGKMVDKVHVKEGDTVKKGDLLVELSSSDIETRIQDLEYSLARNQLLLEYLDEEEALALQDNYLNKPGWYSDEQYQQSIDSIKQRYRYSRENYQDTIDADARELAAKRKDLKASRVYSELDGVVYKLKERLTGSTSNTTDVVMYIVDSSKCMFEAKNPEMVPYIKEGEVLEMTVGYSSSGGTVELIPVNMSEWDDIQLFEVLETPDGVELKMGTSGTLVLETDRKEGVLTIPVSSVYSAGDEKYCYVLKDDNSREMKWIKTGKTGDSLVEVTDGLSEGEKVIRKW